MKLKLFALLFVLASGLSLPTQAQEDMLGEIKLFAGNFAPRNWAICDGRLLPISSNTALFSILGTTYGGDGRTTFALPDLRGRVPMGPGSGPGLSDRKLGEKGGTETNTLTTQQIPAHHHVMPVIDETEFHPEEPHEHGAPHGVVSVPIPPTGNMNTANTGANQPVNNVQPYTAINYIICTSGSYPSRE